MRLIENPDPQESCFKGKREGGNIALIGPWPRPWGGISVHISRLSSRLRGEGFEVSVYDDTGAHSGEGISPLRDRWVNRFALTAREKLIHYHSHSWGIRMRLSLMTLRGKRVVFSVHSMRNPPEASARRRPEFGHMLVGAHFIAVNEDIAGSLSEMGAKSIRVISPYISPLEWSEPNSDVRAFAEAHSPTLAANAFSFKTWGQADLYGLFSALEATALLKKDFPKTGLIVYLSQIGEEGLFGFFGDRIKELGLEHDVLIRLNSEEPFHTCLSLAHVFLRPTFTDGFSVSVAEALEKGVPVVASDAVPRPGSVILFKAGDPADMAMAIKKALSSKPSKVNPDSFPDILDFYERIL